MYSGTKENPLAIAEGNIAYYDPSFSSQTKNKKKVETMVADTIPQ